MNKTGFTIIEIIIAIILVGLLSAMAMPNFSRSIKKGYERNAIAQLQALKAAAELYKDVDGGYPTATNANVAWINSTFQLNLIEKDITFRYTGNANSFTADAILPSGTIIRILELPVSNTNPCCESGVCLLLTSSCP